MCVPGRESTEHVVAACRVKDAQAGALAPIDVMEDYHVQALVVVVVVAGCVHT